MERGVIARYNAFLEEVFKLGKRKAHIQGFSMGFSFLFLFGVYGLGFWVGFAYLVPNEIMLVGDVLTVFFTIIIGAMGIGQVEFLCLVWGGCWCFVEYLLFVCVFCLFLVACCRLHVACCLLVVVVVVVVVAVVVVVVVVVVFAAAVLFCFCSCCCCFVVVVWFGCSVFVDSLCLFEMLSNIH